MKYLFLLLSLILGVSLLVSCGNDESSEATKKDTVLTVVDSAEAPASSIRFAAWLEGAFGNHNLQFFLEASNNEVTGKYRYLPNKTFLNLKGIINGDKTIQLTETNDAGMVTGNFTGVLNKSNNVFLPLKWTASAGNNKFSVELSPVWMQYEEDSLITTGKYTLGLKIRRITESTLGYAPDQEGLKEKDVRASIEKDGVYSEDPSSSHAYVTDQYVEFISSGMNSMEAMKKLNRALDCPVIEKVLTFKIPVLSDLKFSEDGSVGKFFSGIYFSYYEQNLLSMNSYYTNMMAGAAHPDDGFMLASYNLDTGMKMEAADLFDLSRKQEINDVLRKKIDEDCVSAMQQLNEEDPAATKNAVACVDIASKDNAFNITKDKVSFQWNACGFPYMARYCATLDVNRKELESFIK
jgi:hypothetical protein